MTNKKTIKIGLIGAGYMGKRHAVAMQSVASLFPTSLVPECTMIATSNTQSAQKAAYELNFLQSSGDWQDVVNHPEIQALIIASPQTQHHAIALAAAAKGLHILCEKPLGISVAQAKEMRQAAQKANIVNMVGFNYMYTPVVAFAKEMIASGVIGEITSFRGEHNEDFQLVNEVMPPWRMVGEQNGTLGDLSPHLIHATHQLVGPMTSLVADIHTFTQAQNDDHAHLLCRFANTNAMGNLSFNRGALGRKMGLAFDIFGTKGAIRFDQEDQNALYLYEHTKNAAVGFKKILAGPEHGDYGAFCVSAGHGTGYQDQLCVEAKVFLNAISDGSDYPNFDCGIASWKVIEACRASTLSKQWVNID